LADKYHAAMNEIITHQTTHTVYVSDWGLSFGLSVRSFYRAMHFSAKRGIAIACRLSVRLSFCLSVCNVGEL